MASSPIARKRLKARPAAAAELAPVVGGMEPVALDDFDAARIRTQKVLTDIATRWRDTGPDGVAGAIERMLEDERELGSEGHAWSREVGLAFVTPTQALQCVAAVQSPDRDGLTRSKAGGPVRMPHPGVIIAPAPPCGCGLFAATTLSKGLRLGEYTGETRSYDVWVEEIKERKRKARGSDAAVPFIREELYAAWGGSGPKGAGVVIDAHAIGNPMRFINHSCSPNVTFKPFGEGAEEHYRLEVVTLRAIEAGEQLSVDYGWYNDPPTLEDIHLQALEAYREDSPLLEGLSAAVRDSPTAPLEVSGDAPQAVQAVCEALEAAGRGGGPRKLRTVPPLFLSRFLASEELATCLEKEGSIAAADTYECIPATLRSLYEVVGAERVGVPCRCALDPSFSARGRCSGIIGGPLKR